MCYNTTQLKQKIIRNKIKNSSNPDEVAILEKQLEELYEQEVTENYYNADGFAHPKMLIEIPGQVKFELMSWGLIPGWTKDKEGAKKMQNYTINARGETIFEKPSFRSVAKSKRCLVPVNGFFEHHHHDKKTYPFQIKEKNKEVFNIGGLYDEWVDKETGEIVKTFSIVTTPANHLMELIHNNPKAKEPRMPLVLDEEKEEVWVRSDASKEDILELVKPLEDGILEAYSVPRLRGKEGVGNSESALEKVKYKELQELYEQIED